MVCYSPLRAFWSRKKNANTGNYVPVFSSSKGFVDKPLLLPCGKCEGCLLARSFQWSVRCVCESYSHDESYFLTLTYDDEHLPSHGELCRAHFQSFMKRLRFHFRGYTLKVFYCGEYGERRHRPHYHAIIFGLPLSEKNYRLIPVDCSRKGNINYHNEVITRLWNKGLVRIGTFTPESCAYVAQYTLKKNKQRFSRFLVKKQVKPFVGASNRNAIGFDFFMKYYKDIFSRGIFNPLPSSKGKKTLWLKPLPIFKRWLQKHFPILYIKYVRIPRAKEITRYRLMILHDKIKYAEQLDKKLMYRYYKEKAVLRNLEVRD